MGLRRGRRRRRGLIAWVVLQTNFPVFKIPEELSNVQPTSPPEEQEKLNIAVKLAERNNTMLAMGIIGTIFYWTANEEVRHSLEVAEEEAAHHHDLADLADQDRFDGESITEDQHPRDE